MKFYEQAKRIIDRTKHHMKKEKDPEKKKLWAELGESMNDLAMQLRNECPTRILPKNDIQPKPKLK